MDLSRYSKVTEAEIHTYEIWKAIQSNKQGVGVAHPRDGNLAKLTNKYTYGVAFILMLNLLKKKKKNP